MPPILPPRPFLRLVDKKLLCASYSLVSVKANRAKKRIALYIDRSLRSDKGDWMGLEVASRSRAREREREREQKKVVYFSGLTRYI